MADDVNEARTDEQSEGRPRADRKRLKAVGVILGVMVLEAVVIVVLVKSYVVPQPQAVLADQLGGLDASAGQRALRKAEVEIAHIRALNEKSPRVVIYDMNVYAVVPEKDEPAFREILERRKQTVRDRFVRVVRGADPSYFQETELTTLRAQFQAALSTLLGDEITVHEVLVPSIIPYTDG